MLVEQLDEAGEFESERTVRTLTAHLKAVSHYENQEEAEKTVISFGISRITPAGSLLQTDVVHTGQLIITATVQSNESNSRIN
jgi:hypothetical protein